MKSLFTLPALAALLATGLSAHAQFTVDGNLNPAEVGTGAGKYQLVGTYTGTHSVADRGLKALYMGTTSTTLNVMVVASPETTGYNALVLYLDMPNKTGVAAGTRLPGGSDGSSQLRSRPTLDMAVDYAFRTTVSPLPNTADQSYYSIMDCTVPVNASGQNIDTYLGPTNKAGTPLVSNGLPNSQFAFQTTAVGSVSANAVNGWELSLPLSALGGASTGNLINVMVAYVGDNADFYSDVLPTIPGQSASLGTDPNFTTIPGKQYFTYQVGTGVLAARPAAGTLAANVAPNPLAADSRLSYTVAGAAEPVSVVAYNSLGQRALTLLDATSQPAGEHSLALAPLQALAPGVYVLHVRNGSQQSTQRVVVQ